MKLYDQHVHTLYSFDSDTNIEDYLNKAKQNGVSHFVFTDHIDFDVKFIGADAFVDYYKVRQDIERLKNDTDITILTGVEIGYRNDYKNKINKILKEHKFDLILLSVHESSTHDYLDSSIYTEGNYEGIVNLYFEQMLSMLYDTRDFDVLAHIDYAFRGIPYDVDIKKFESIITMILMLLIAEDKALEVNTKSLRNPIGYKYMEYFIDLYISIGGSKFTIGSDAHELDQYMSHFDDTVKLLKSKQIDEVCCYINRKCTKVSI